MSASESLLSNLSNEDGSVTFSAGLECRPSSRLASSKSLAGPDSNDQKSNEKLEKEPKPSIVRTEYNRQTLNSNLPFFYEVGGPHRERGILLSSLEVLRTPVECSEFSRLALRSVTSHIHR
ncbi:hypothetical protein H101_02738 [Trichophyton interdigitale H6]|nr:hypothetical protein H101_02738 [Trichophyton interdigitale H6]